MWSIDSISIYNNCLCTHNLILSYRIYYRDILYRLSLWTLDKYYLCETHFSHFSNPHNSLTSVIPHWLRLCSPSAPFHVVLSLSLPRFCPRCPVFPSVSQSHSLGPLLLLYMNLYSQLSFLCHPPHALYLPSCSSHLTPVTVPSFPIIPPLFESCCSTCSLSRSLRFHSALHLVLAICLMLVLFLFLYLHSCLFPCKPWYHCFY